MNVAGSAKGVLGRVICRGAFPRSVSAVGDFVGDVVVRCGNRRNYVVEYASSVAVVPRVADLIDLVHDFLVFMDAFSNVSEVNEDVGITTLVADRRVGDRYVSLLALVGDNYFGFVSGEDDEKRLVARFVVVRRGRQGSQARVVDAFNKLLCVGEPSRAPPYVGVVSLPCMGEVSVASAYTSNVDVVWGVFSRVATVLGLPVNRGVISVGDRGVIGARLFTSPRMLALHILFVERYGNAVVLFS